MIMSTEHLFSYTLTEEADGRVSAVCNEIPGCATYGKDAVEAVKALADAIAGAVKVYEKKGWPVPAIASGKDAAKVNRKGVLLV